MENKNYVSFMDQVIRNAERVADMHKAEQKKASQARKTINYRMEAALAELEDEGCLVITPEMVQKRADEDSCEYKEDAMYESVGLKDDPAKRTQKVGAKRKVIIQYDLGKNEIRRWYKAEDAAKDLGMTKASVSIRCAQGLKGMPVHGNYYAAFKED